ncbi:MAG: inositol monophosphatase [Chloroflexi bacterium]|nr:inositol monophosphatase [Chloroflexota bacterium]
MTEVHLAVVADLAAAAARAGGAILRESYGDVHAVRFKGEVDLVTEVDVNAERAITDLIRAHFPHHQILAEEGTTGGDDPQHRWIIDPLDGTTNYAHGLRAFCVSVGYELEGRMAIGAIYDPNLDELFLATAGGGATLNGRPIHVSETDDLIHALLATGFPYDRTRLPTALRQFSALSGKSQAVRRIGSAALDCAWVAAGRFDGYWENLVLPWDVAAGSLIVAEAGGIVTDLAGEPFRPDSGHILVSNLHLHEAILTAVTEAGADT